MMNKNIYPQDVLDLLFNKDFDALSLQEQKIVVAYFNPQEYRNFRSAFLLVTSALKKEQSAHIHVPVSGKVLLDKAFARKYKRESKIFDPLLAFLNYRIPAWQIISSILLIIGAVWYMRLQEIQKALTDQAASIDTVFIEKELPLHMDTVYLISKQNETIKTGYPKVLDKREPEENTSRKIFHGDGYYMQNIHIADFKNMNNLGRSIKEDSLPAGFTVGIM
jgi:hypothetical protein